MNLFNYNIYFCYLLKVSYFLFFFFYFFLKKIHTDPFYSFLLTPHPVGGPVSAVSMHLQCPEVAQLQVPGHAATTTTHFKNDLTCPKKKNRSVDAGCTLNCLSAKFQPLSSMRKTNTTQITTTVSVLLDKHFNIFTFTFTATKQKKMMASLNFLSVFFSN